jgi:hypothetical protein
VVAYFPFQIWIQCGKITKIHLFSSEGKTKILNLFFSVIKALPPQKNVAAFQVKKTGGETFQKFHLCDKVDIFPLVPHFVVV